MVVAAMSNQMMYVPGMDLLWCWAGADWVVPGTGTRRFPVLFFMVIDWEGCCCRWCARCGWARFCIACPGHLVRDHSRNNLRRWAYDSCHALGIPYWYGPLLSEVHPTLIAGASSYGEYGRSCWK